MREAYPAFGGAMLVIAGITYSIVRRLSRETNERKLRKKLRKLKR